MLDALRLRLGELARSRPQVSSGETTSEEWGAADKPATPSRDIRQASESQGWRSEPPNSEAEQDAQPSVSRGGVAGCPPWVLRECPACPPGQSAVGVEAFLPGGEWRDERGAVFVHERLRSEVERRRDHWGAVGEAPEGEADLAALCALGLERALFLDLETGGLASSPVFLAGTMHWNGGDFVLRQYFARHYGEEATLLAALDEAARGFDLLVTFNGKSYDVPFLRGRASVHRVPVSLPPRHIDLLHPARRRWKLELPDCRLQTLELRVCRRRRTGDVPGDEVPGLYHDYVRHGDPYRLVPVFHHNLLDVITMGEVLSALCGVKPSRRRAEPLAAGSR